MNSHLNFHFIYPFHPRFKLHIFVREIQEVSKSRVFLQRQIWIVLYYVKNLSKGPFIYYVITFLGFLDPPPPLRNHVFSTENNQKLAFSDPPSPQVIT